MNVENLATVMGINLLKPQLEDPMTVMKGEHLKTHQPLLHSHRSCHCNPALKLFIGVLALNCCNLCKCYAEAPKIILALWGNKIRKTTTALVSVNL